MPDIPSSNVPDEMVNEPVRYLDADLVKGGPQEGIALCLSGGGYRAMLFHLGCVWRLFETGYLARLDRISSVSGGSITAGVLGLAWNKLFSGGANDLDLYRQFVVGPVRSLAGETIDATAIVGGIFLPGSISEKVQKAYRKHLFHDAALQDLPDRPRFVINATNVQSGVLWRFSKPYMRDYRVGEVRAPKVAMALAVAASSAFPPLLSPLEMGLDPADFTPGSGDDLQCEPFTKKVILTDGGVYDNLGLETAWKRYRTILVSDAGGHIGAEEEPKEDWARHSYRVLNLIDSQVRSLRKRQLISAYENSIRKGAYWGIRTNIADYGLADPLPCPFGNTTKLAEVPTRLKRVPDELQEQLINWGYAVCDAALRKHVDQSLQRPADFPYPSAGL
ncbi:MAG TPA: patatin-like phospholipase family protein [Syntrophorhabdaceae bacterium]|nr:patatin-like phospholipase family protein [Syntrophorhabdaceae bacterium]